MKLGSGTMRRLCCELVMTSVFAVRDPSTGGISLPERPGYDADANDKPAKYIPESHIPARHLISRLIRPRRSSNSSSAGTSKIPSALRARGLCEARLTGF